LIDHLERGRLKLDQVKTIILDEADEMISMGFKEELERILGATDREQSNTWLFSATMGREVSRVAKTYLREPKRVQVNREEMLSANVEQYFYAAREADKPEILCKIIENADDLYGLIFCQTKSLVTDLTTYLGSRGYKVDCLHGDMDQRAREKAMQGFRDRKANLLVCTDVASRGLDVKDVTHVFNYSLPREIDNYVHRIGRTARGGKTGIAVNLVTPSHRGLQRRIEGFTKSRMIEGKVPTRRDIGTKKISKILGQFKAQESHDRATSLLSEDWNQVIAEMPTHEIIGRFLTLLSPEIFEDREKVGVVLGEGAGAPAREEAPKSPFRRPERPSRFKKKPKGKFSKRERPPRGRPKKKHRKGTSVVGTASR
jgi:ATP-dependent RNA helicase DeaD